MRYAIKAVTDYGNRRQEYTVATFDRKADAQRYLNERCYTTPTRYYQIVKL